MVGGTVGILFVIHTIGPETIVTFLGVRNLYVSTFLFSVIAGVSFFTAGPFYLSIGALTAGGLDPYLLAAFSGVGLTLGDTLFYYLGATGRKLFMGKKLYALEKLRKILEGKSEKYVSLIIFVYTGMTPFPGDILSVTLAFLGYPFKKAIVPMLAGNIFLVLGIGLAGILGFRFLF
jgi:membrane protein YqaA with SNARE-associated domain